MEDRGPAPAACLWPRPGPCVWRRAGKESPTFPQAARRDPRCPVTRPVRAEMSEQLALTRPSDGAEQLGGRVRGAYGRPDPEPAPHGPIRRTQDNWALGSQTWRRRREWNRTSPPPRPLLGPPGSLPLAKSCQALRPKVCASSSRKTSLLATHLCGGGKGDPGLAPGPIHTGTRGTRFH